MDRHGIHLLDTVELKRDIEGVPRGTVGAVVSEYPDSALVEIVSAGERDLIDDLVSVPFEDLRIVQSVSVAAR